MTHGVESERKKNAQAHGGARHGGWRLTCYISCRIMRAARILDDMRVYRRVRERSIETHGARPGRVDVVNVPALAIMHDQGS